MTITNVLRFAGITLVALSCVAQLAVAATHMADDRISDIVNTKHNFAALANPELPTNDKGMQVKAATQNEVCVFCHTPHGKPNTSKSFLWNHEASSATYTKYSSSSLKMTIDDPGEASKMCLSCHDGTVAVGAVDVFNGQLASEQTPASIEMSGDGQSAGLMVDTGTGYNSNLGTDLRNDHPVGVTYDDAKIVDGVELVKQADADYLGPRTGQSVATWNTNATGSDVVASTRIALPLEKNISTSLANLSEGTPATFSSASGSIECTTCHDPHIRSTTNDHNIKFLRLNRFQEGSPSGGSFSINQDINCIACHKKAGWSTSVHGSITHADEVYDDTAADDREFPRGIKVSEASCLNCHDAHTEEGARYLLREGADDSKISAIQETCYQCHTDLGSSIITVGVSGTNKAKDIKNVVNINGGHQPFDFLSGSNAHDIKDSDLIEEQTNIRTNRHVTCTDCHNPHRMIKNEKYDNSGPGSSGTHVHSGSTEHSNIASGVMAGMWGVEPNYPTGAAATYNQYDVALTYDGDTVYDAPVKHGAPSGAGLQLATKEYQVCLKCHSNFGYENAQIGSGVGQVSNTAMELLPDNGDPANLPNHNSWHPVAGATGRTTRLASNNFLSPFDVGVGTQTMYCSDCHTSTNDPSAGAVGPHGSTHSTGLVKNWDVNTGTGSTNDLCFECHEYDQYANGTPATTKDSDFSCNVGSGCGGVAFTNLHVTHASKPDMDINAAGTQNYTCSLCHVRVSHGWKNKGMLVDKITEAANTRYYFNTAQLAIDTMRASGQWEKNDCATSGCH